MRIDRYLPRLAMLCILLAESVAVSAQTEDINTIIDIHHILGYLVAGFLITVFVMIFYNRLIYYKEQQVAAASKQLNAQLGLILDSNKTEAWTYDIKLNLYKVLSDQGTTETSYTPIDFSQFYDRDDFSDMRKALFAVRDGEDLSRTVLMKSTAPKIAGEKQRIYEITISVLRRDRHGRPLLMLGTQHDITDDKERSEQARNMMLRFHTVFESSLVDMMYFDEKGTMIDINDKACESYFVKDRSSLLAQKPNINDFPSLRDMDLEQYDEVHASSIVDLTKIERPIGALGAQVWGGDRAYYERATTLIKDHQGRRAGIVLAGRNITDMVNSHHHQRESSQLLEQRTKDIQQYIQNINYSLKVSDVRLMNYYPDTHELEITSDLSRTQYHLPQVRAIALIKEEDRRKAKGLLSRMDRRRDGIISETLKTIFRDKEGRDVFLHFNVMPILDKEGRITHYFGMCRNETEMTYTEQQLKMETEKAQEAEQLKNTFLENMSYELRTPLNAVIGFAELYANDHSEEDEAIFAEEIKKNTTTLLQLINDILYLSRLDAHMIEYSYQEYDFAQLFEGWCYMGWSNLAPGVKAVVENPYSSLMVEIDQQNLGSVIQKICTYSGMTTAEGSVRAKYEYRHGELMITIEDTGAGMDATMLPKAFDRFANGAGQQEGTGLDLPIVKELIEQMGGNIELQSERGKGNTFLVSIPCKMIRLDKKAEILI